MKFSKKIGYAVKPQIGPLRNLSCVSIIAVSAFILILQAGYAVNTKYGIACPDCPPCGPCQDNESPSAEPMSTAADDEPCEDQAEDEEDEGGGGEGGGGEGGGGEGGGGEGGGGEGGGDPAPPATSREIPTVHISLNAGRATMSRVESVAAMGASSLAELNEVRRPRKIGQMMDYYEKAPVKNIWPVTLNLDTAGINPDTFNYETLTYNHAFLMSVNTREALQILNGDFLVDVRPHTQEGFVARWWPRSQVSGDREPVPNFAQGTVLPSEMPFILPTSAPIKMVTVTNPNPLQTYDKVDIYTEQDMDNLNVRKVWHRHVIEASEHRIETWKADPKASGTVASDKIAESIVQYLVGAPVNGVSPFVQDKIRIEKVADLDENGNYGSLTTTSRIREIYSNVAGLRRKTEQIVLAGASNDVGLSTTYGYYDDPEDRQTHGKLRWQNNPDGSWIVHEIKVEDSKQIEKSITPFKNGGSFIPADDNLDQLDESQHQVVTKTIIGTEVEETISILGQLVSKKVTSYSKGTNGERVRKIVRFAGTEAFTSYRAYFPFGDGTGDAAGRVAWEVDEDGTGAVYSYVNNSGQYQVTIDRGAATGNGSSVPPTITAGVREVENYDYFWQKIISQSSDIESGLSLGMWAVIERDHYGRPEKVEYNGNENDFELTTYTCCGPSSRTDRSGAVTENSYDLLKRIYKTVSKRSAGGSPVTVMTRREGLTTTVKRTDAATPSYATALLVSSSTGSLDGLTRTTISPDADNDPNLAEASETTTRVTDPSTRTTTTTYPNGTTSVVTTYRDGRTSARSGTAITAMTYDYGTHAEQGGGLWSKTIAATGTEWTKSYSDQLGRTFKMEYPDGAIATSSYYGPTAAAGSRGKLKTSTDPDENDAAGTGSMVTYAYNAEGERTTVSETLADSHTRTSVTAHDVIATVTIHGTTIAPAIRNTSAVNSVLVSTSYSSVDGYTSASSSLAGDSLSLRSVPDDGAWTATSIGNDGVLSRAFYSDGLMESSVAFEAGATLPAAAPADITAVSDTGFISGSSATYDAYGRTLTSTDSRTGVTTMGAYLENGALTSVTTNGGADTTSYTYDVMGRRSSVTLPDATKTYTTYTDRGEVEATYGSQTYPTFRSYDAQGRMSTLRTKPTLDSGVPTNAGGSLTTWSYDSQRGWLANKRDADSKGVDYTYTAAGRLETREWARTGTGSNRVKTTYTYDQGMLETVTYTNDPASTRNLAYTYDAFGRPLSVTQANQSHIAYDYDATTLVLDTETISYDFDHDGTADFTRVLDRSQDSLLRPNGWQIKNSGTPEHAASYGYDTAGRLKHVHPGYPLPTSPSTPDFTYTYESESYSLVETLTGPAHTVTNSWETTRDILSLKESEVGSTLISSYSYGVNEIGQRETVDVDGTAFSGGQRDRTWTYDDFGQLETEADANNTAYNRGFAYDAIGNRTASIAGDTDPTEPGAISYTPDSLNQYSAIGSFSPSHDDDGNAEDWQIRTGGLGSATLSSAIFIWDAENRLIEIQDSSLNTIVEYTYDSLSRRIRWKIDGGADIAYLYDGWNPIAEYDISTTTPSLIVSNLWGLDLSGSMQGAGGVGGLLSVTSASGTYYPTCDGNGNVSEYLDSSGTNVAHYEYDAFGNVVNFTESTSGVASTFRHRFSTKQQDDESGLYYYGYRYYDPVTGRWPSRDPIGERGGVNLYGFVLNTVVNLVDYMGLQGYGYSGDDDEDVICDRNCDIAKIWQGRIELEAAFGSFLERAQDNINSGADFSNQDNRNALIETGLIPGMESKCPGASCIQMNGKFFENMQVPECWMCHMERGGRIVGGVLKDHFWITCEGVSDAGVVVDSLVIDLWRSDYVPGESPDSNRDKYPILGDPVHPGTVPGPGMPPQPKPDAWPAKGPGDIPVEPGTPFDGLPTAADYGSMPPGLATPSPQ